MLLMTGVIESRSKVLSIGGVQFNKMANSESFIACYIRVSYA